MGFIRGGLLVVVSIMLFLSFLIGNVFLTLTLSLDYDVIKPELVSVLQDVIKDKINLLEEVTENFARMQTYCESNSEFIINYEGLEQTFVIPCDVISQGFDSVIEYHVSSFVEDSYYKDYQCEFWDCLGKETIPFFLVSKKAQDYWNSKFYFLLGFSLILILLVFLLVEQKTNLPIVVGSLLAVSSLPFMKIEGLLSLVSDTSFLQFFTIFFTKAHTVFLISLISGLVILGAGIGLKFIKFGSGRNKENSKPENKKKVLKKN